MLRCFSSGFGRALLASAVWTTALLACDGDDDVAPDETGTVVDAAVPSDATLTPTPDAATDASVPIDASDADADPGCGPGATVRATVTADGASLALCGATLDVPAAALEVGTEVGIDIVAPPDAAWHDYELSGPVFRFLPDTSPLPGAVTIGLARDTTRTRGPELAYWASDRWEPIEACLTENVLSLDTVHLGIFGLMQDAIEFPPGPTGLGQASLELELEDEPTEWTVPAGGGYAVYEGTETDRSIMVVAHREADEVLKVLDVRMIVRPGQPPTLLQVSYISTDDTTGGWSYVEPVHGAPVSFTLTETTAGTYEGALEVVAHKGDATAPLEATFTVTPAKYRPPPSYSCGFPEGDPP